MNSHTNTTGGASRTSQLRRQRFTEASVRGHPVGGAGTRSLEERVPLCEGVVARVGETVDDQLRLDPVGLDAVDVSDLRSTIPQGPIVLYHVLFSVKHYSTDLELRLLMTL